MSHRRIVLVVVACQLFGLVSGCELTSSFLTSDFSRPSSFYTRMTSTPIQDEWWPRFGEYFVSKSGVGHGQGGLSNTFWFDDAILREGRRGDLLRALRSDLLEMATDSGATVARPLGQRQAELRADGFEFDYSEGSIKGKVRVEIKPAKKAGAVDVSCLIEEKVP